MESEDKNQKSVKDEKKKDKKEKKDPLEIDIEDLSEQDLALMQKIDKAVEMLLRRNTNESAQALQDLEDEVKNATTSMTSIPKPLKFINPHYTKITDYYKSLEEQNDFKLELAQFISVLSMTMADEESKDCITYLLQSNPENLKEWGFQYIHYLCGDIAQEYNDRLAEGKKDFKDLLDLSLTLLPLMIENNSEEQALDLLMEVDQIQNIIPFVSEDNMQRITLYLTSCSLYCADQYEIKKFLNTSYEIYMKMKQYVSAMRIAIKMNKVDLMHKALEACDNRLQKKQMAIELGRQRVNITFEDDEELENLSSNKMLAEYYVKLVEDLDVKDAKHPDQIYKINLDGGQSAKIDSKKQNVAHTIVNSLVNAGMGNDSLMLVDLSKDDTHWTFKVKDHGLVTAVAGLGMIHLYDFETGSGNIAEYLDYADGFAKQGAYIAIGLMNMGIRDEVDPAKAMLEEGINSGEMYSKLGGVIGLGFAYAGSCREDMQEILVPFIQDEDVSVELSAMAALSLGLIFCGSADEEASNAIVYMLVQMEESQLNMTMTRFYSVALALLYLGQQEDSENIIEILGMIEHPIKQYTQILIEACAYVGTGNVLKIQKMLQYCVEEIEKPKTAEELEEMEEEEKEEMQKKKNEDANNTYKDEYKSIAVIGIALIATSEEIGNNMALRMMDHLMQVGSLTVKRAVPLAIAILHLSNPNINIQDLLAKLAHAEDEESAFRSIFGLGLIGAGTNNSRLANILRGLALYYEKDPEYLYLVRIAQGILHMGKGLLTIQPYYSDRFLLSKVSMAGIVILANAFLDTKRIIQEKNHWMLYYLGVAAYPKWLFTIDENGEHKPVEVRVGNAVDVVGQAGKPKRITGFQTHTSPVLIQFGERAEIANEKFLPVEDIILENFVFVTKNKDYQEEQQGRFKK